MADKNPFASVGLGMFGAEGQQGGLGQDVLALATAYGIDKSGLKTFLNDKGFAKNAQGQWGYQAPAKPASSALDYQNGSDMGGGFNPAAGVAPPSASPVAPVAPTIQEAVVPNAPAMTPAPITTAPPAGIGNKILDNDWHGSDNSDQQQQNQFASQSASEFVPTMGYKPDYASDRLKQFAMQAMMG